MAFKNAASRKAFFARGGRPKKSSLRTVKQDPTWYLQDPKTGQMVGRDDDARHPKGTVGKKDGTKALQDKHGFIWGRKSEPD
jgi:hypothetical protein